MENEPTNNMYNPLVKAAAPNSIDDILFNAPENYLRQRDAERFAYGIADAAGNAGASTGNYVNGLLQEARTANEAAKPRWNNNPASRLMGAARDAAKNAQGVQPKTSWESLLETIKKYYGFAKDNIEASGGVANWLGGNSKTLGGAPRWLVAGGGLAGLLGLGLGARSLLSKSGSYHPVQGLPMAKLASARAMRAEDPTLLGGVSPARPDITEGNSIGRMLDIIRTHGNRNTPYGATMPKSAADDSEGQDDEKKKIKVTQSGALKRTLTGLGTTTGGTLLGGGLGALAGSAVGGGKGLLAGMILGSLAGGGTGLYAGDRIAVGNGWIPDELSTTPGQIASVMGGALAGGVPASIASAGKLGFLGALGGGLLGNYLHKKLSGRQYPKYEIVDDM